MKRILLSIFAFCCVLSGFSTVIVTPMSSILGTNGTMNLDMNADGTPDFAFGAFSGANNEYLQFFGLQTGCELMAGSSGQCFALQPNGLIGPNTAANYWHTTSMVHDWVTGTASFLLEDTAYIGVRFLISGNIHYGYLKVMVEKYLYQDQTQVFEVAYQDVPGWAIRMGNHTTVARTEPIPSLDMKIAVSKDVMSLDYGQALQGELDVYSLTGQLLDRLPVDGSRTDFRFSHLAAGAYLVRLKFLSDDSEAVLTRRVFLAQ